MSSEKELYIVRLKYEEWQKDFYFEGDNSPAAQKSFQVIVNNISEIGEKSASSNDFFSKAIEIFNSNGFYRVAK